MKCVAGALTIFAALLPCQAHASPVSYVSGASTYAASSPQAPAVVNVAPAAGATLTTFFPQFSATIDTHGRAALRRDSMHLYVDGTDVTPSASLSGNAVSYTPHAHLAAGWHDVFLEGSDTANQTFSDAWVFQTRNPDVVEPQNDGGFAFVPVGGGPQRHGGFMHFFLFSPFDGAGLLQLCGFELPFARAGSTPVLFLTVPAGLAGGFFGCNAGALFTPFGIGQTGPFFFPIEVAGPGFFDGGHHGHHHPRAAMPSYGAAMPSYGTTAMPQYRSTVIPAYGSAAMPVYRTSGTAMPLSGVPLSGVPRSTMPRSTMPLTAMPRAAGAAAGSAVRPAIPIPYIPH